MLQRLWNLVSPAAGSALAVAATIAAIIATRLLLKHIAATREGLPFRRQIASTLIGIAGLFAIVILLPIGEEVRAQILSVLGILLSAIIALSSTTFVGNAMAGFMLRTVRGYRPGDFVEVGDVFGRVSDQGLFHTEVQTIRRDLVMVPNLYMIQHPVQVTRSSGTFVSAKISLGYDIPRDRVEKALLEAAGTAELGEAFVLIPELADHAVTYEIYGLLEETNRLLTKQSALRKASLDALHAAGIEVASPSLVNRREYPPDHTFTPPHSASQEEEVEKSDGAEPEAEELAFDRAEEAESIEKLKSLRERLVNERQELGPTKEKQDSEREEQLRGKIEHLDEIIEKREKQHGDRDKE